MTTEVKTQQFNWRSPNDQTSEDWKIYRKELGTGLYLSSSPYIVQYEENVTYDSFLIFTSISNPLVIKWVPLRVKTLAELKATECNDWYCSGSCVEPGCLCHDQKCHGISK